MKIGSMNRSNRDVNLKVVETEIYQGDLATLSISA